jgi:hypothetical protein
MGTGSDSDGQASSGKVSTSTGDGGGNQQRRSRDLSDEDVEEGVIPAAKRMNLNADTLSQDDYFLIAAYFRHCNVMIPCVDEVDFRSMLNALEEQQNKILTEPSSTFDSTVESYSKGLYAAVSDSKFASFRVLLHTVLCCSALIEGHPAIARHHYGVSCALIPLCLNLNSKHLVSALLVLSLISRSMGKNSVTESLQHVRLARQISDQATGVSVEVRTMALVLYEINSPGPLKCALTLRMRMEEGEEGEGTGISLAAGIEARLPHERLALYLGNIFRWIYAFINMRIYN